MPTNISKTGIEWFEMFDSVEFDETEGLYSINEVYKHDDDPAFIEEAIEEDNILEELIQTKTELCQHRRLLGQAVACLVAICTQTDLSVSVNGCGQWEKAVKICQDYIAMDGTYG